MATTAMDYEAANGDRYEDETPRYERDNRSASPRPARDDQDRDDSRRRSVSPSGRDRADDRDRDGDKSMAPPSRRHHHDDQEDDGAVNPGSNLFVTGIHPRLSEAEITKMFEKYGDVEKCQIMRDPHTKESRGFGFVKMVTAEQAEAAKEGLQGEQIEGRTMSIEKARRARPRTPTPGKYFGPPKRDGPGGGRPPRHDDRRGGGRSYGREDPYRYRGYDRNYDRGSGGERRYEDRSYDRGGRDDRRYDERSYTGRDSYDRGYERRDRDDSYRGGRESYGGRDDRERYAPRGGASGATDSAGGYGRDRYERPAERDAPRSRDPPAGGAGGYGDSAGGSGYY